MATPFLLDVLIPALAVWATLLMLVGVIFGLLKLLHHQEAAEQRRLAHSVTIETQDNDGGYQVVP